MILDAGGIEPHSVILAGPRSTLVMDVEAARVLAQPAMLARPMFPNPVGDGHTVTVTQSMNHRRDSCQVFSTARNTVPPTESARRLSDHRHTMSMVCVCPLLAQFAEFHNTSAAVVVCHASRDISSGERYHHQGFSAARSRRRTSPQHAATIASLMASFLGVLRCWSGGGFGLCIDAPVFDAFILLRMMDCLLFV